MKTKELDMVNLKPPEGAYDRCAYCEGTIMVGQDYIIAVQKGRLCLVHRNCHEEAPDVVA